MYKLKLYPFVFVLVASLQIVSCKAPAILALPDSKPVPASFNGSKDTTNTTAIPWKDFFKDKSLEDLIDTALLNNQELLITLQEIEIAKNEIRMRHGKLLPSVGLGAGIGIEKVGTYTSQGAGDASAEIVPGEIVPENLTDYKGAAFAHWEIDIWKKLRNAKKAAITRYLATIEGKNFVITNLIAEIADSYYELLALDNQLDVVKQNIELQKNALEIVKVQKEAAKATELAVQKFQAEVLASQNLEFGILQNIKEMENKINFLLGRYPQEIKRTKTNFLSLLPNTINAGIPAQLLANRPDIKQAELELIAAKLDIQVARAEFFPSLEISAVLGLQAFRPAYFLKLPESILYSMAADIAGPIINRNAIKAEFNSANSRQLQSLFNYQRVLLNAYLEVANGLSRISNLEKSFQLKTQQVDALKKAIDASNDLFKSARVDYFEVLMTQRDALESTLELVEIQKELLTASVHIYRNLGGGWK
jgi:outer membrane protein, multidrug efflux system